MHLASSTCCRLQSRHGSLAPPLESLTPLDSTTARLEQGHGVVRGRRGVPLVEHHDGEAEDAGQVGGRGRGAPHRRRRARGRKHELGGDGHRLADEWRPSEGELTGPRRQGDGGLTDERQPGEAS